MTDTAPKAGYSFQEIRDRHSDAIERFSKYYEPHGLFDLPHLTVGVQGFGLRYDREDDPHDEQNREWLGIMLCAALKNLVEAESQARIAELEAERDALREAITLCVETEDYIKRGKIYRDDGVNSKHDECVHGLPVYNGCDACMAEHLQAALTPPETEEAP